MRRGKTKVHVNITAPDAKSRYLYPYEGHDLWPGDSFIWPDDGTEEVVLPDVGKDPWPHAVIMHRKVPVQFAIPFELDCSCLKVYE